MDKAYFDVSNTGSFGGLEKLRRATKSSRKQVVEFGEQNDVYNQYKPIRHRFTRRRTIAYRKHELHQADLADLQKLSRHNSGYRYILVCIDVLSKYVFYIPVKNKKSQEMQRAFNKIFKTAKPKLLQTDRGSEFVSREMQDYFKRKGIHWYHTYSENKATLAERQIRTLKETLTRIFHHSGNYKYIHLLDRLAETYNNTPHSRTLLPPSQVNETNEKLVFDRLFGGPRRTSLKPKFNIGDQVRIAKTKGIFSKGHERRWTEEVFRVKRIKPSDPIMYYVEDVGGEEILGGFYGYELVRVVKKNEDLWDIEKVIKKRRNKDGKMEYFVKWRGYDSKYNSWVTNISHRK